MVQGVEPGGEVLWQNNVIFILSCPMSKLVKFMYVCMYLTITEFALWQVFYIHIF